VLCRVVRYPASCCFVYDLMYTFHLVTYAMYGDMPTFLYLSQGLLHSRMCSCHRIVCFVAVHSYMDYVGVVYLPPLLPMDYGAYTHLMVYYFYFIFILFFLSSPIVRVQKIEFGWPAHFPSFESELTE